jgi:hypothetical protein
MRKLLVFGVIVLFLGVAIAPSINANINKTLVDLTQNNVETPVLEDITPKQYLYETIIQIANNPDIKRLLSHCNQNLFTYDFDNKVVLKQLFFKDFQFLFSILLSLISR